MAARSGTCAMCAAGWEGGEEADWRGDVACTAGGCRKRGNKKAYSTQHPYSIALLYETV